MTLSASYRGMWKSISRYWQDYGGWRDFCSSPLFHFSIICATVSYSVWMKPEWNDLPLSLLPNLLGFSLGAYALIFSLADERLLAALNVPTTDGSPTKLRMINATFLHFILVQTIAIIFALMNKSTFLIDLSGIIFGGNIGFRNNIDVFLSGSAGFIGYFLTVYAVALLIGAALAAYRLAILSGRAASISQQSEAPQPPTSV
ncbi:MAG: putative rane protein [Rhizorhabdus sp.]|nr:putative rane protein [Rhizorhabdus sp.]